MINVFITNNMTYTPFKGFHEIDIPFFQKNNVRFVDSPNNAQIIVLDYTN